MESEWESFKRERSAGIEEIMNLRRKVASVQKQQEKGDDGKEIRVNICNGSLVDESR